MPTIPSILLKKLYHKGSLRNTEEGFEFVLKNTLAPGTIVGVSRITLDGNTVDLQRVSVCHRKRCVAAEEITAQRPIDFGVNESVTLRVAGEPLAPGAHEIVVVPNTREVGELAVEIRDTATAA